MGNSASVDALFAVMKKISTLPLSIVANCAGIGPPEGHVTDVPEDVFDEIIRVNLKVWKCTSFHRIFASALR